MYILSPVYTQFCQPPWRPGMRIQRGGSDLASTWTEKAEVTLSTAHRGSRGSD